MKALFLAAVLVLPSFALAEKVILFVNMNYSRQELAAIEKIQKRRGLKLVVVPPMNTMEEIKKLEALRSDLKKAIVTAKMNLTKEEIEEIVQNAEGSGFEKITREDVRKNFSKKIQVLRKEGVKFRELEEKRGSIDHQIRKTLDKIRKDKDEIDNVSVSAHSDGGDLSSETSNLVTYAELQQLTEDYKDLWKETRHVLLLGCYTNTQTANLLWHEMFPNAHMIAGFRGQAPRRDNIYSSKYVDDVMGVVEKLDDVMAKKEPDTSIDPSLIEQSFKQFESVRITDSAIDYCKVDVYGLPDAKLKCYEQWLVFRGTAEKMDQRFLGPLPSHDPPKKTMGTILRSFYDMLQKLCSVQDAGGSFTENQKVYNELKKSYIYKTIRLIHWWNLQKNFSTYHRDSIKELNELLKKKKVLETMPDLQGKTGRIEFLQQTQVLEAVIQDRLMKAEDKLNKYLKIKPKGAGPKAVEKQLKRELATWKKASKLFEVYKTLEQMDKNLPLTWVEPNAVLQ